LQFWLSFPKGICLSLLFPPLKSVPSMKTVLTLAALHR
jgi:hypothetical protein